MRILSKINLFITLFLFLTIYCFSQQRISIQNISAGYRIFEIDDIGNNPLTVSPFLKNKQSYLDLLNSINVNSLGGNPGPFTLSTFYLNAEIGKQNATSFWKRFSFQAGMYLTKRFTSDKGFFENLNYQDDTIYNDKYLIKRQLQFAGINIGINRRWALSKRFSLLAGLQWQSGIAIKSNYTLTHEKGYRHSGELYQQTLMERLPGMPGRNYYQWQVMLPLAAEYKIYLDQISIKAELIPGLVGNHFRGKNLASGEAHGAGLWLIYHPAKKIRR